MKEELLSNMDSKINSIEEIKKCFNQAIIENYRFIKETPDFSSLIGRERTIVKSQLESLQSAFNNNQFKTADYSHKPGEDDFSDSGNGKWRIVGKKNLFGLSASLFPRLKKENGELIEELSADESLYLNACAGRFDYQKFNPSFFGEGRISKNGVRGINISDLLDRENCFSELEEFYNMNNRQVFEKYGCYARMGRDESRLLANALLLDSMLEDKYDDIDNISCQDNIGDFYYGIKVALKDGTEITLGNGVEISQNGKTAQLHFNPKATDETKLYNRAYIIDINDLTLSDMEYSGDQELIDVLQNAVAKEFHINEFGEKIEVPNEGNAINLRSIRDHDEINNNVEVNP